MDCHAADLNPEDRYAANLLALVDPSEELSDIQRERTDQPTVPDGLTEVTSTCSTIPVPRIIEANTNGSNSTTMSEFTEYAVGGAAAPPPPVPQPLNPSPQIFEAQSGNEMTAEEYMGHVNQTFQHAMAALRRQQAQYVYRRSHREPLYPNLSDMDNAVVSPRRCRDPEGSHGSIQSHRSRDAAEQPSPPSKQPQKPNAPKEMVHRPDPPEEEVRSARKLHPVVMIEEESEEPSPAPQRQRKEERSPSPYFWQVRYLKEQLKKVDRHVKKKVHHCPLPALERQWSRDPEEQDHMSQRKAAFNDPPTRPIRTRRIVARPDPPEAVISQSFSSDVDDSSTAAALVGAKLEFQTAESVVSMVTNPTFSPSAEQRNHGTEASDQEGAFAMQGHSPDCPLLTPDRRLKLEMRTEGLATAASEQRHEGSNEKQEIRNEIQGISREEQEAGNTDEEASEADNSREVRESCKSREQNVTVRSERNGVMGPGACRVRGVLHRFSLDSSDDIDSQASESTTSSRAPDLPEATVVSATLVEESQPDLMSHLQQMRADLEQVVKYQQNQLSDENTGRGKRKFGFLSKLFGRLICRGGHRDQSPE